MEWITPIKKCVMCGKLLSKKGKLCESCSTEFDEPEEGKAYDQD